MAKLTEISEEERVGPEPKKQRRDSTSEEIDDQDDDEEEDGEDIGEEDEDEEGEYEHEAQVLVEDENSTETQKIDEEFDEEVEEKSKEENEQRFFLTDLEMFDCAVCLQRLSVPIVYLCENEHVACSGCFTSLNACSICRPSTSYKRCRILEKILRSIGESCEYLKYGCMRPVHYTMKLDHERFCKFMPCSCPVEPCSFVAPSTQMSLHLTSQHSDSVARFSLDRLYSISLGFEERFCVLLEINTGDVFVIINAKHDIGNTVSVSQLGPRAFRNQYSLDLNAKDGNRLSLQFKCEIESIRSVVADVPLIRDFLLVPSRYFEGDEGFELLIRISHSGY